MNIFLAVLVAILGFLGAIALRAIDERFETVIGLHNANNVNIETIIKTSNTNTKNIMTHVEANKNRSLNNAEEIENITAKMEEIIADIHRLDEDVKTIDKSEREIRSYYINFREPTGVPNGGVPWAKDMKVGEDNE